MIRMVIGIFSNVAPLNVTQISRISQILMDGDGTALQFRCAVCGLLLKQAWQYPASIPTQNHLRDFVPSPSIPQMI